MTFLHLLVLYLLTQEPTPTRAEIYSRSEGEGLLNHFLRVNAVPRLYAEPLSGGGTEDIIWSDLTQYGLVGAGDNQRPRLPTKRGKKLVQAIGASWWEWPIEWSITNNGGIDKRHGAPRWLRDELASRG